MSNKIKTWLTDLFNLGMRQTTDDVNINIAKANYQKYQDDLEQKRQNYIKRLCALIKEDSRRGSTSIVTVDLFHDFMTYDFMMEMKEYFEQRGFTVKEESNRSGIITSWLRISWE